MIDLKKIDTFCQWKLDEKKIKKSIEELKEEVEGILKDSNDHKIVTSDYELELRERSDYDYTSSGHPEYNAIEIMMKRLEDKKKKLEAFLQRIPDKGVDYKLNSGETVKLYPPQKTTKNIIYFKEK